MVTRAGTQPTRRRRQLADLHVLRYVPGASPMHRAWAGSKILAITFVSIGLVFWPTWAAAAIAAVLTVAAIASARLPRGVVPRVPRWIWIVLLIGAFFALIAGTKPYVHFLGLRMGLGRLDQWAEFWVIGIEILALAALLAWTTPLADLAPALGRLLSPLRRLRVPIDDMVATIALSIRCLPLLVEEVRVLAAARRTRRPERPRGAKEISDSIEELLFTAMSSALRRAREMAEAIEARGGTAVPPPETHPIRLVDGSLLTLSALALLAMVLLR